MAVPLRSDPPVAIRKTRTLAGVCSPFGARWVGARWPAGRYVPERYGQARIIWWTLLALVPTVATAAAPRDRLQIVATSASLLWNGVAATADGRIFVDFPRMDAAAANPSVAEVTRAGAVVPFPGGAWNAWRPGADPRNAFVSASAIHLGPDHRLWVVDNAAVGMTGRPPVSGGQKVVVLDPATRAVVRVYPLGADVLRPRSAVADIRFNGRHAYLTDAGAPGLIVLDLDTGRARRVLDRDRATTGSRPIIADGHILRGPDGAPVAINADQLAVTPDGAWLYEQPLPGPLYRMPTRLLDDPAVPAATLSKAVEFSYDTPSLGGLAIDAAGNLYLNDLGTSSILKLGPDRHLSLVVHDGRLHWAGAPAIDGSGNLLVPVPQLDRIAAFNHGRSAIVWPVALYRIPLGARAPANE